jgi:hypothetical protein
VAPWATAESLQGRLVTYRHQLWTGQPLRIRPRNTDRNVDGVLYHLRLDTTFVGAIGNRILTIEQQDVGNMPVLSDNAG